MLVSSVVCALLLCASVARGATWSAKSASTLLKAVQQAAAGDTIELEAGDYVLTGSESGAPALHVDKPLTLRSRDANKRAVLRGNGAAVLLAVTSSDVTVRDVVIGRAVSGADERHIDVYVASGSQALPASSAAGVYGARAARTLASRTALLGARAIQTSGGAAPPSERTLSAARALHDVQLINVDFTHSLAGTNVAFASGAYAGVRVERCVFGRADAAHINALVGVGDAQFDALRVRHCTVRGAAHVLFGSPSVADDALALNYWAGSEPHVWLAHERRATETYCLDAACTHYAPVVDGAQPQRAFASLEAAVRANVRHLRVTGDVALRSALLLTLADTVLEGGAGVDGCGSTPLLSLHAGGALVSANGALSAVRNLRVALLESGTTAFVFSDGAPQQLAVAAHAADALVRVNSDNDDAEAEAAAAVVHMSGVSVLGTSAAHAQAVLVLSAPRVRVEWRDSVLVDVAHGAVVQRGALVARDVTVSGASRVAFYAETATHEAALRLSGCTVIGGDVAIELGARESSSALRDFGVSCSQFLFGARRVPVVSRDCEARTQRCAAALHYNTIVSAHAESESSDDERAMLRAGANYVEYARRADDYVYAGEPRSSLAFGERAARAELHNAAGALFVVASHAALSAECLPIGETAHFTPQAAVVSGALEVRSDALLHECGSSVTVHFDVARSAQEPAVFGVARIGEPHHAAEWAEQPSAVGGGGSSATLDVSATLVLRDSADNRLHRSVVLAQNELTADERAALDADALPAAAARVLCVVCGDDERELTARELELYCQNDARLVRTSFAAAYAELRMGGNGDGSSAALLVAGECALPADGEPLLVGNHEHIARLSPTRSAALVRAGGGDAPLVRFAGDASAASLRHIALRATSADERCAVHVALSASGALGPTVDSCALDGSLCVEQRYGGHYTGNEIGGAIRAEFGVDEPDVNERVVFEANRVFAREPSTVVSGGAIVQVAFVRNAFMGAHGGLDVRGSGAQVRATANTHVRRLHARDGARLVAFDNELLDGASIELSGKSALASEQVTSLRAASVRLDDVARLSNVHFDAASVVLVDSAAAAVLRNVQFDDMSALCATDTACRRAAVSARGVDLAHSRILNVDGAVVLDAIERDALASNAAAYWSAPAHGAVTYCRDANQVFNYHPNVCACGAPGAEDALRVADAETNDERRDADGVATQTHVASGVPLVLWLLLGAFFLVITCCVVIGLCVQPSDETRVYSSSAAAYTSRAALREQSGAQYLIGASQAAPSALNALRVRKKHRN